MSLDVHCCHLLSIHLLGVHAKDAPHRIKAAR